MMEYSKFKGWQKFRCFGLKKEWLEAYFNSGLDLQFESSLGNRQLEAFKSWLKAAEILDEKGNVTQLGKIFYKLGVDNYLIWEFVWVNIVFNFPTAYWYTQIEGKSWTVAELKEIMHRDVSNLASRTIVNAINELVGTFKYTPIGKDLKQGEISYGGSRKIIVTRGKYIPHRYTIIYNLLKIMKNEKRKIIKFSEHFPWPWVIFGCEKKDIFRVLIANDLDIFEFDDNSIKLISEEGDLEKWLNGSILITLL